MREDQRFSIAGNIVDVHAGRVFPGTVFVQNCRIEKIVEEPVESTLYLMPGFVDAHVHVESSMLVPSEFARLAVVHGSVGTVSDPHEIGNVLGVDGVRYMIESGKRVPFKFNFGAPSCVPATTFETAGAEIDTDGIRELMAMPEVGYLAEMMNFPGVLNSDPLVMEKIRIAHEAGKPVDGHAPGLRGAQAKAYIEAGMSSDHECFTKEEALDKLRLGMKVQIREGSAAKNFEALHSLVDEYPEQIMFCSDDKHPNDLVVGHINLLAQRAVAAGMDTMKVIRACTKNVVEHYGMDVGMLRPGDPADFIAVEDLESFKVLGTWIDGAKVAEEGKSLLPHLESEIVNNFHANHIHSADLEITYEGRHLRVMEVEDGQLITKCCDVEVCGEGCMCSDPGQDLLKMVVFNRYDPSAKPAIGFVRNFGLKNGAIAGSVAHDSHNIIAVGVADEEIAAAINAVVDARGGVSVSRGGETDVLPLPVAGLMNPGDGYEVAARYEKLDKAAKDLGSSLASPFMTLSFCALLVIPALKLSDRGLFDGEKFEFCSLFAD